MPIKEAKKKENIRLQIILALCVMILAGGVIMYANKIINRKLLYIQNEVKRAEEENRRLEKKVREIAEVKKKKEDLQRKLAIIKSLKKGKTLSVKIMNELVSVIPLPKRLWFESLTRKGKNFRLQGVALDDESVSDFIKNLKRSKLFTSVSLLWTKEYIKGHYKLKRFYITFRLV